MKCPNCGAEIGTSKSCGYCGTQISLDMQREQEQLNKQGCPKCHSTNIQFNRENQGEVRDRYSKQIIHRTVGFCKDCGYTWYPNITNNKTTDNMFWWLLGWIFFFPVPAMVLIWRKKNTWDTKKKIIATVIFWIIIFIIGLANSNQG